MKQLSRNWFSEGMADLEYKQYIFLAYLQYAEKLFKREVLFPVYKDVVSHYNNLKEYLIKKTNIFDHFPREAQKLDLQNFKIIYHHLTQEDSYLLEMDDLVKWALPKLQLGLKSGEEVYKKIEKNIDIQIVGIRPLYLMDGFIIIPDIKKKNARIYEYKTNFYISSDADVRSLTTRFVCLIEYNYTYTPEKAKNYIYRVLLPGNELKWGKNPATFSVSVNYYYPFESSLLPVARMKLSKTISAETQTPIPNDKGHTN